MHHPTAVLTEDQVDELGRELDAIRTRIVADLGQADRDYPVSYTHLTLPTNREV